jgi:hypothetical protein
MLYVGARIGAECAANMPRVHAAYIIYMCDIYVRLYYRVHVLFPLEII